MCFITDRSIISVGKTLDYRELEWEKITKEEENHTYYFHSDYKTFEQAQEFCKQEAGNLIEPNEETNHAISSAASSKGINKFWVGIRYDSSSDPDCESSTCTAKCDGKADQLKFVYASNNQALDLQCRDVYDSEFTFWSVDPPECGEKCDNYCVKGGYKWNAIPCETKMAFMCEKLENDVSSGQSKRALFTKPPTNKVQKITIKNTTLGHFKERNTQGKYSHFHLITLFHWI